MSKLDWLPFGPNCQVSDDGRWHISRRVRQHPRRYEYTLSRRLFGILHATFKCEGDTAKPCKDKAEELDREGTP